MVPTDSSFVYEIGHDGDELLIVSLRGETYKYFGVPEWVFQNFLNADSKGSYYHQHIKGKYNSIKEEE